MSGYTFVDLPERITRRIDTNGPIPTDPARPLDTGCWIWTGGTFPAGYGSCWLDGKNRLVHQVIYEAITGKRSSHGRGGNYLDHVCRVRRCCNPDHLDWTTPLGNMLSAQRPTCRRGHPFTPENTAHPKGKPTQRVCKTCRNATDRAYRKRRRAAA